MKTYQKMLCAAALLSSAPVFAAAVYPSAMSAKGLSERTLSFDGCHPYGSGFDRKGNEIVCDNGTDATARRGASWGVTLDQKTPAPFAVTAESRVIKMSGTPSCDYSLYLDVAYADGTKLYGQFVPFVRDPSRGWQRKMVVVTPEKPVKSFSCNLLFRGVAGCVRFRAPVVKTFDVGTFGMYDTCLAEMRNSRALTAPAFLVRDVVADRGFVAIAEGSVAEGLSLRVKEERIGGDVTRFDVTVDETTGRDRAVTLVYAVPIEGAAPLTWHADPRVSLPVDPEKDQQFQSTVRQPIGEGEMTRWPFGAVSADGKGVALGIDCTAPAFFRVVANARQRQLFIAFDLGFAKEHPSAHFRFVRFGFPAKHGFRGALATYQALFPELHRVRIKEHGLWMAFWKISKVEGWEDFGFKIKEGDGEPDWDDAHGILTFHYTEPSTWWMTMPKGTGTFSFADCFLEADRLAANGNPFARAWRVSAFRDEEGRPVGSVQDAPWCKGAVWNLCPLPGIPGGEYAYKFAPEAWEKRYGGKTLPQGVDGEYIDSAEGYLTAQLDFCREHFAYSRTPLSYANVSKRPGLAKPLMFYEYVRETSDRCHAIGRYMMANGMPVRWPWLVMYSDYNGQEVAWIDRKTAQWKPVRDEDLLYRRALNGGKPYCFLMNVDFDKFPPTMVEKYMQKCLAYGIFPSFFSPDASGGHYFSRPELYNRDRPLFKKYVPLCRKVSEAGWRAVNTLAASERAEVFVEQFGDRYLTVFNPTPQPQEARIRALAGAKRAKELVAGGEWRFKDGLAVTVLPPETVRVLDFR